jgi:hypothetical protein
MLTEHNRLNGTLGCSGAGSFNNHTKEYISKWAAENTAIMLPRTDKPFPVGVIPIESFGPMITDQPQYLIHQNKSKQATSLGSAPIPIASKPLVSLCMSQEAVKKDTEFISNNDLKLKLNGNKTAVDLKHLSQIKNTIASATNGEHHTSGNMNTNNNYHHQSKINGNSKELIKPEFSATATAAIITSSINKASVKQIEMAAVAAAKKKLNSLSRKNSGSNGTRLLTSNNNHTKNKHELITT